MKQIAQDYYFPEVNDSQELSHLSLRLLFWEGGTLRKDQECVGKRTGLETMNVYFGLLSYMKGRGQ